jgi:hypothetical protein
MIIVLVFQTTLPIFSLCNGMHELGVENLGEDNDVFDDPLCYKYPRTVFKIYFENAHSRHDRINAVAME